MQEDPTISPVNPLPPVVVVMFLAVVGIEIAFFAGSRGLIGGPQAIGWRISAVQAYAFSGDIFDWMWENWRWPGEHLLRFVTYPFVHAGFTHAVFVGVILLAMGKMVAERFGQLPFVVIFFGSGIVGALSYAVLLDDPVPLVGGFPPVYGLIGAFTFLLWQSLGQVGGNQVRAFTLIGFLMGFQLVFGLLFGAQTAWVADLSGFAAGFVMSFVLIPGGWRRVRDRIRHD